jgi:hypothetical protein
MTQSAFAAPCQPMSGGADSNYQPVAANATNVPSFPITVNNTQPAWFFCKQTGYGVTLPVRHIICKLTIYDIVTVSRAWSSPATQQRTSHLRHSRLLPRRHPLMAHLPLHPTRLAQAPVLLRAQQREQSSKSNGTVVVGARVVAFYSRLFSFFFSPRVW